jgi:hypothetical protein
MTLEMMSFKNEPAISFKNPLTGLIPKSHTSESSKLRMSVRIVSSKQVFPPGDEEEGEILYNLRIDVGRTSQPCVN